MQSRSLDAPTTHRSVWLLRRDPLRRGALSPAAQRNISFEGPGAIAPSWEGPSTCDAVSGTSEPMWSSVRPCRHGRVLPTILRMLQVLVSTESPPSCRRGTARRIDRGDPPGEGVVPCTAHLSCVRPRTHGVRSSVLMQRAIPRLSRTFGDTLLAVPTPDRATQRACSKPPYYLYHTGIRHARFFSGRPGP